MQRYLGKYPELTDDAGRVNFDEVKRHRDDNPAVAKPGEAVEPKQPKLSAPEPDAGSRKGTRHRLEEVKTWQVELDWAKQTGQVVDPTAIIDALSESAVALRDKFMAPDPVLCERIAGETDPRVVMTLLRENARAMLDDFAAAMKRIAGGSPAAPGHDGA